MLLLILTGFYLVFQYLSVWADIFLWFLLKVISGASYIILIYGSLSPFGLREVVGNRAGVVFSSAYCKGSYIYCAVKLILFIGSSSCLGELKKDLGLLTSRLIAIA